MSKYSVPCYWIKDGELVKLALTEAGERLQGADVRVDSGQRPLQSLSAHLHLGCSIRQPQEELQNKEENHSSSSTESSNPGQ